MRRREFLRQSAGAAIAAGIQTLASFAPVQYPAGFVGETETSAALPNAVPRLPGTSPLTAEGDFAMQMVDGIHRFLLAETDRRAAERSKLWNRDYTSAE